MMSDAPFTVVSDGEEEPDCEALEISPDEPEIDGGEIRKNLFDDFKELDPQTPDNGREYMRAYLRIRPFTEDEKGKDENKDCMEIEGESAILLNAPRDSFTFKNEKRGREVTHRFTFSRVFGPETTQKDFFDETSLGLVRDFVDGQNCLVFTYGVTNSGKTYTIQGTAKDGGVLPRTLDVLFNSIHGREYNRMDLKPRYFCDVMRLDKKQEHMEDVLRNGLIMSLTKEQFDLYSFLQLDDSERSKMNASDESSMQASMKGQDGDQTSDQTMDKDDDDDVRVADGTTISVDDQGDVRFSIWVSFAEIYNELIYDLLEPCPEGKGKKRPTLKLGDDKHGNPYVKGLREVCVANADEAYKILKVGKKNQTIASTKLNHQSSRSHCIFSIKILRVVNVDNPHVARVSRLSFVDLAGSERYSKTQSTGDRLKEAGNINTSLMTLGKCLDYLRYNQQHPNNPQMIPFRESKLTRLFQGFFCGKGKAAMVVNINQCASTFDETYHALKFSAIAKQVTTRVVKPCDTVQPPPEKSFRASFAFNALSRSVRKSVAWENGALSTPAGAVCATPSRELCALEETPAAEYQQQLEQFCKLLQEQLLAEKKEKFELEKKIREEVCAEMAEQLVTIENEFSERVQETVKVVEEKCDRRIELLVRSVKKSRKRPRMDREDDEEWVPSVLLQSEKMKVKDLASQVSELSREASEAKQMLEEAGEAVVEKDAVISRLSGELDRLKTAQQEDEKQRALQDDALNELRACLETSSKEVEIARIKLDQRDRRMREKEAEIEDLKRQLRDKEETVSTQAEALTKVSKELEQTNQELENVKCSMEGKFQENQNVFQEKCAALRKEEELVNKLQRQLKESEESIERKVEIIESGRELLAKLKSDLEQKSQALLKEEAASEALKKDLQEKEILLGERYSDIETLNKQIEEFRNKTKPVKPVSIQREQQTDSVSLDLRDRGQQTEQVNQDNLVEQEQQTEPKKPVAVEKHQSEKELAYIETHLSCVVGKLRDELANKEELMKELVQSLEETRAEKEFERRELLLQCEEHKMQISTLQKDLENNVSAEEMEALRKAAKEVEEELQRVKEERESMQELKDTNDFEKEEVKSALELANARITELEKHLESHYEELNHSRSEKNTELESLRTSLEASEGKVKELRLQLVAKDSDFEKLKVQVGEYEDLKLTLESMSSKLEQTVKEVEIKTSELETRAGETLLAKESLEVANKKIKELQAQLLTARELTQQECVSKEASEVANLRDALEKANSKVAHSEEILALKAARLKELVNELDKMKKDLDAQKQAIEESRSEESGIIGEMEEKLKESKDKISKLEGTLNDKAKALEKAHLSLKEAETKLEEMSTNNVKAVEESNEKITSLKALINQKDDALEKIKASLKEAEERFQELNRTLEEVQKEKNALESKIEELTQKSETLMGKHSDKEKELEKATTESVKFSHEKDASIDEEITFKKVKPLEVVTIKPTRSSNGARQRKRSRKGDESETKDEPQIVVELEKQLEASTRALDKKNTQLIARNNTIKRLELNIIEKNKKIDDLEVLKMKSSTPLTPGRDQRTREELRALRKRAREAENEVDDVKEKLRDAEKKLKSAQKDVVEITEEKEGLQKMATAFEQLIEEKEGYITVLKKELQDLNDQKEKKSNELLHQEKLLKEKQQQSACVEKQVEQELALLRCELAEAKQRAETAEAAIVETSASLAQGKAQQEDDIKSLMEKIASKEAELRELGEKLTKSEQEKSDELGKVWETMTELQSVIEDRGKSIDKLEKELKDQEAKHNRQKNTLEQTVAKMKEVMERKGGDANKVNARVAELEKELKEKTKSAEKLVKASEKREKEIDALKRALQDQDQVMEEQQDALTERQLEIESLTEELRTLTDQNTSTNSLSAEIRRLEGTLSVYIEEKDQLQRELDALRKTEAGIEVSKVEISRDYEIEKSEILVKLEQKEGVIAKMKTQQKSSDSAAAKEKRLLKQQLKEKEFEINKLNENLEKAERKQKEYEDLIQLKDVDVRKAAEEKEGMLKAMREAFEVASTKKTEYENKLESVRREMLVEHERELARVRESHARGNAIHEKEKERKLDIKEESVRREMLVEHERELARERESHARGNAIHEKDKERKLDIKEESVRREMQVEHERELARVRESHARGNAIHEKDKERKLDIKEESVRREMQAENEPELARVRESHSRENATHVKNEERKLDTEEGQVTVPQSPGEDKKLVVQVEKLPSDVKTKVQPLKKTGEMKTEGIEEPASTGPMRRLAKRRPAKNRTSDESTTSEDSSTQDRIEIDVTPIMGRRRTRAATKGSRKRRSSSELSLAEIKAQLSAAKCRRMDTDDETPGSVSRSVRTRSTAGRTSSVVKSRPSTARKTSTLVTPGKPPIPLTPKNESSSLSLAEHQSAKKKKKGFFGKLFDSAGGENSPPRVPPSGKKRKLLKKDISGPMDTFSPTPVRGSVSEASKDDPARRLITRQLRSRK
ncbi:kinesin-like protein KIF20B isoform X3 [Nematostella vectensis]|uniref:kinesin-like protein KIF20B isoform X3 n=1 Tax=Nematostella vectensis TaxID=45351 RepID=UPI00207738E2|nr:kinesin-like protein KIF20B isoform X3 [Nematostella vectensis]